jgi:hypothetical protein
MVEKKERKEEGEMHEGGRRKAGKGKRKESGKEK